MKSGKSKQSSLPFLDRVCGKAAYEAQVVCSLDKEQTISGLVYLLRYMQSWRHFVPLNDSEHDLM